MFHWLNAKTPAANTAAPASLLESTPSPALTLDDSVSSSPSSGFFKQPGTPTNVTHLDLGDDRYNMPSSSSPINIATPSRNTSSSPSSQGKRPVINYPDTDSRTSAMMSGTAFDSSMGRSRQDSFAGARPIAMNNANNRGHDARQRRESMANSLVQGMSWGGVSVGSWIRDDIMMAGTSPFPYQSPSYHSSSYLPKLEANFMKDFNCCGLILPTLHDLLQHYEEAHAQQTPQSMRTASAAARARDGSTPNSKAAIAAQAASAVQQQAQQQQNHIPSPLRTTNLQLPQATTIATLHTGAKDAQPLVDTEMDGVEDMEMDDAVGPMDNVPDTPIQQQHPIQAAQPSLFGQQQRPVLNLNSNGMQHQGLRTSQPPTPATSGFGFQNNPTVSSVNTPTLSTQPLQQQQTFSPDPSVPGTPAEDEEYSQMQMNMAQMNMMNMMSMNAGFGFGGNDMGLDLCIDEPAKRLYSPNGGVSNRALQQQFSQFNLGQGQGQGGQYDQNNEMMRAYRQQQMMALNAMGNPSAAMMMAAEEHKPFKCPVVGCEKAYKNQNGLKYHKTHGHQTQQLHDNADGTFSIVNPETSTPYPGTLGMEKEKPYKCEVCGKRYKNLNGLKYHKQHSPPCNPELKLNSHMAAAGLGGMAVNVAGLPGIEESQMM
ncbi:C2H2 and C2HC zinc finger [Glarea lozoyensis ATCC 20868]|uniref:C2H2 and C2HC zinc finger n=2 Tax=Glarea lozoyensis TaxID=101852 RepID=S3CG46_GLAL2|nr:C2H2 and C2HC zinc finger [Glarea lozoyensis ATCC 20868]EPE24229.1 C2H2 and C2HC zinc finger [Glarea lozoyensis ATCC 20868]